MYKLAAIIGPTAVGKTNISIKVAQELNAEIISCDSMQIYQGMDIGTAKATVEEQNQVAHHLIDLIDIHTDFSVADYQKLAKEKIAEINGRGKIPILVGGTGLYYQSVVDDYLFYPMESQTAVRNKWETIINHKGLDFAYEHLKKVDPEYAGKISVNDRKRIVRALEVFELSGKTFSEQQQKSGNTYNLCVIGLELDRRELYRRIEIRVDQMINQGLIDEVQGFINEGCDLSCNGMQALGYKQVYYYLKGFINKEEMINEIKKETRRYAKRQYTWFKKDKRIIWIDYGAYSNEISLVKKISSYIAGQLGGM